jgi:hypothetical protein
VAEAALLVLGYPAPWITHGSEVAQLKSWLGDQNANALPK